ncbi:2-oxoacid:acceptor oxidoreductase subunit alpha [candidate division KSB1 bacterium]|nr:MAG: 2-oxoacid:acceptor oxidoreductase subunit alpha [candidate division KSB1 bacterium]
MIHEERAFWPGNEIIAEAAIRAGCTFFAGYPITPSSEIASHLALRLPQVGGTFIQMEDEIAAMGAIIGGSLGGAKSMTATSGPGLSLKSENIGFAVMAETPCVIVDVQRGGPATGLPTAPAQGDIMQARWGTHGDHSIIALTPLYPREVYIETMRAFHLAELYRTPVFLMVDEIIAHMTESFSVPADSECPPVKPRSEYGESRKNSFRPWGDFFEGQHLHITGLSHTEQGFPTTNPAIVQRSIDHLVNKIVNAEPELERYESYLLDDADIAVVTFGSPGRASREAINLAREKGIKVGMFRIITFWPFPVSPLRDLVDRVKAVVVPEMNMGMLRLQVEKSAMRRDVPLLGVNVVGGIPILPELILDAIEEAHRGL